MSRERNQTFAKKSLGQNFLVDPNYITRIVAAADPQAGETIVEIGPGRGAITTELVDAGARVVAIELDRDLASLLAGSFKGKNGFCVIEANAIKVDFAEILEGRRAKLVANLPYYISTAILQHLAEQRDNFVSLTLMFQKEVVHRITAPPGSSDRGYLTVLTQFAFSVEHLFDIPPTAFRPVPKVTSSVARFLPKPKPALNEDLLQILVSTAFAQKRKTILNNLKFRFPQAEKVLERSGIDPRRRAESLTLDEWSLLRGGLEEGD